MSTTNPMTLPSASTLTDEQLRVLCALTQGFRIITPHQGARKERWPQAIETCQTGEFVGSLPDPLHNANAAIGLLDTTSLNIEIYFDQTSDLWTVRLNQRFVGSKSFKAQEPDFCRAVVIAVLRAEGKIL